MAIDHNQDGVVKQSSIYSWKSGAINKAGTAAATDITTIAAFADLFTPFGSRKPFKIRVESTGTLYLKLNGGDVITVSSTAPFEATDLVIRSVYVSDNSGAVTATVYLQ